MWDYGVRIPLWADGGLLPEEPEWLHYALGLSEALIAAMAEWGDAMDRLDGTASSAAEYTALDLVGRALAERLQAEVGDRYTVVYRPW
jgi:hypothetical protein